MARLECCGCHIEINTRTTGVAEQVTGWRVQRKSGGANQIAVMKGQGRWLCAGCFAVLRAGRGELEDAPLF